MATITTTRSSGNLTVNETNAGGSAKWLLPVGFLLAISVIVVIAAVAIIFMKRRKEKAINEVRRQIERNIQYQNMRLKKEARPDPPVTFDNEAHTYVTAPNEDGLVGSGDFPSG